MAIDVIGIIEIYLVTVELFFQMDSKSRQQVFIKFLELMEEAYIEKLNGGNLENPRKCPSNF